MWQCKKCREENSPVLDACWSCGTRNNHPRDSCSQKVPKVQSAEPAPEERGEAERPVCPKCRSPRMMLAVPVIDHAGDGGVGNLSARLYRSPSALIFKRAEEVALTANICGRCGHAELYAANPAALWSAHQEARRG